MENENKSLATKIVDKLAEFEHVDVGYQIDIPQIGHIGFYAKNEEQDVVMNSDGDTEKRSVAVKTTKDEARKLAIDDITNRLDNDEIVLSDDWASSNL